VRVAEGVHGDAAEEVEVAAAVGVPHVGALAADEHALRRAEGVHDRTRVPGGPLGAAARAGEVGGGVGAGVERAHCGSPSVVGVLVVGAPVVAGLVAVLAGVPVGVEIVGGL